MKKKCLWLKIMAGKSFPLKVFLKSNLGKLFFFAFFFSPFFFRVVNILPLDSIVIYNSRCNGTSYFVI